MTEPNTASTRYNFWRTDTRLDTVIRDTACPHDVTWSAGWRWCRIQRKIRVFLWYIIISIKICVLEFNDWNVTNSNFKGEQQVNYKLELRSKNLKESLCRKCIPRKHFYLLPEYCTHFFMKKRHAWYWESRVYVRHVSSEGRSLITVLDKKRAHLNSAFT